MQATVADAQRLAGEHDVIGRNAQPPQHGARLGIAALGIGGDGTVRRIDAADPPAGPAFLLDLEEDAELVVLMGQQKERHGRAGVSRHRSPGS